MENRTTDQPNSRIAIRASRSANPLFCGPDLPGLVESPATLQSGKTRQVLSERIAIRPF
jgi:hypothetical protein